MHYHYAKDNTFNDNTCKHTYALHIPSPAMFLSRAAIPAPSHASRITKHFAEGLSSEFVFFYSVTVPWLSPKIENLE
jgi:hypothetical protein